MKLTTPVNLYHTLNFLTLLNKTMHSSLQMDKLIQVRIKKSEKLSKRQINLKKVNYQKFQKMKLIIIMEQNIQEIIKMEKELDKEK
jgi:hypothetical protein